MVTSWRISLGLLVCSLALEAAAKNAVCGCSEIRPEKQTVSFTASLGAGGARRGAA